jgi:hypothetical protein
MESLYWFVLTIMVIPLAIGVIAFISYQFQYHWSHPKHHFKFEKHWEHISWKDCVPHLKHHIW